MTTDNLNIRINPPPTHARPAAPPAPPRVASMQRSGIEEPIAQWKTRPDAAGLYIVRNSDRYLQELANITSPDCSAWRVDEGDRYFGPIPPDKA